LEIENIYKLERRFKFSFTLSLSLTLEKFMKKIMKMRPKSIKLEIGRCHGMWWRKKTPVRVWI
jgi:hypothetical protein